MADEPIEALGGITPIDKAHTPGMDTIAGLGANGSLFTLPEAFPTSSDVANMSVLGCDLTKEYAGRGVLEAASQGIDLKPTDVAFRVNLVTIENGILRDFSGGHLAQEDAENLIADLNSNFSNDHLKFFPGVSYRNLLVLSGPDDVADVKTEKPDDHPDDPVADNLPAANSPAGEPTAAKLRALMHDAAAFLEKHPINQQARAEGRAPANGIWIWSGGSPSGFRSLESKYGISSAVISAVDVIKGLGRCLGMEVINVPGATGYIDTNYEGKADATIEAIKTHDLVYLHVEAIDEVSHGGDLDLKIDTIEAFDRRVVCRVLEGIKGQPINVAVLPDHPVPVRLRKHTRIPVPVAIMGPDFHADAITRYSELTCPDGSLGAMVGPDFMNRLFLPR